MTTHALFTRAGSVKHDAMIDAWLDAYGYVVIDDVLWQVLSMRTFGQLTRWDAIVPNVGQA